MRHNDRLALRIASITLAISVATCARIGVCPTIGCEPLIQLTYATPLVGSYMVSVLVNGSTFVASCPMQASSPFVTTPGVASCDQNGLMLSAVDLGHGANEVVQLAIAINDSSSIAVTATLQSITNSRDCSVVCFVHAGIINN
jgi:hypothetical protein